MTLPRVRALLEEGCAAGLHLGAQLEVRRAGQGPVSVAVGEARAGVAMTPETLLPWFSCTKALTAVAVAQQWERGRLHLDDPVALHVPAFAAGGKGSVTIRHVLTHTGGFRRLEPGFDPRRGSWDEAVAAVSAAPLEPGWVPGRRAGYDPIGGFHILGEVVRRLDGRGFADYVTEDILEPLDMADTWMSMSAGRYRAYGERVGLMYTTTTTAATTSSRPTKQAPPEVVAGLDAADSFEPVLPAAGAIGPMGDLVKLFEALLGGGRRDDERILRTTTVEAMTARHRTGMVDETFVMPIDWGLGLRVDSWRYRRRPASYGYGDHASPRTFGHGGNQSSLAFADPDAGLAVALCCNGMPGEAANHRRTQAVVTALYEELGLGA